MSHSLDREPRQPKTPAPILPQEISRAQQVFPAGVMDLMPAYADIPDEFKNFNQRNTWARITSAWFFDGLPDTVEFYPKAGIDAEKAIIHLRTIMGSYEPKHEHKEAAVAYLMSQWFDSVEGWQRARPASA